MTTEAKTLTAVFKQVGRTLEGHALALETMEAYAEDARAGRGDVRRLRGFLQGLAAAGVLPYEDYCEVDTLLTQFSQRPGRPEPLDPVLERIRALRDELQALGFASTYVIRAPGSARAPVVYLFAGMTETDVSQAVEDHRCY